jgi:hypothetical protein
MLVTRENLLNKLSKIFPFSLSSAETIRMLVEKTEVVFFESGNLVYMEGAKASNFYIIYEGEIEILVEENQSLRRLNTLHDEDYFGEDALKNNNVRNSSARVLKNTLLIKIPQTILKSFIDDKPELGRAFSLLFKTYTRLFDLKFRDLSHETIYYIGSPHYFVFLSKSLLSFLIMFFPASIVLALELNKLLSSSGMVGSSVLLTILFLMQLTWHYFEWQNDFYVITGKRVINLNKNLINFESRFETPLATINNLEIKKSILGRSIGFGDLVIRTFTGETILKKVVSASEVQTHLEYLMTKGKIFQREEERKSFEKILGSGEFSSSRTSDTMDTQRIESKVSIENNLNFHQSIYHTHWIILFKKILFPTLLLASLILLAVFFNANNLLLFKSSFSFAMVGFLLIGILLWWLYQFIDWRNDQYHITEDQIIDVYRKPFGTEDRRTASVLNIQSIRFERKGLLGLLLNFGTVYIRVGDEEFTFDNVPDPARIQERLFGVLEMAITQVKKSELSEQQQQLADWMESYHQIKQNKSGREELNN